MFFYTRLYNSNTNIISSDISSHNQLNRIPNKFVKYSWKPTPMDLLKWNTDVSRIIVTNQTTVSMVCKHNSGFIIASMGKKIKDVPNFIAETIAIRKTLKMARDHNVDNK